MEIGANASRKGDGTHVPLGLFCIVTGLGAWWVARDYDTGTVVSMGPGFFPKAVSSVLVVLGMLVLASRGRDLPETSEGAEEDTGEAPLALSARLRIILCLIGSIVLFGAALGPLGLPASTFLMVLVASLGSRLSKFAAMTATALVLAVLATVLFPWLLGLQIPVLPEVLR